MVTASPQYTYGFLPALTGMRTEKELEDNVEPDDMHDRDVDGTRAGRADTDLSNMPSEADPTPTEARRRRE